MHPVPRPPTTRPRYLLGAPRHVVIGLHSSHQVNEDARTAVSVTTNGRLVQLAVLNGGVSRWGTRKAARRVVRDYLHKIAANRYDRITVNSSSAVFILGRSVASVSGTTLQVGITRELPPTDHPVLSQFRLNARTAQLSGLTEAGTAWRLTSTKDIGGQVVVHTDASGKRYGNDVGCGWVVEATRLDEPMEGCAVHSTPADVNGHRILLAELLAIRHGLEDAYEVFPKAGLTDYRPVYLYSDNQPAIDYLNGKITAERFPAPAREVKRWWDETRRSHPATRLLWVRGHNGHPGNEAADALARAALVG